MFTMLLKYDILSQNAFDLHEYLILGKYSFIHFYNKDFIKFKILR